MTDSTQTKELKPITFKQAFVIVICLHVAAYVGATQWSAYRKTVKAERTFKPVQTYVETTSKDWPSSIDESAGKVVSHIKTVTEPVIKTTADSLATTINQAQQDLKEIKVVLPNKTTTVSLIEQTHTKPKIPSIALSDAPKPIAQVKKLTPKQEIKIRTVPTPTMTTNTPALKQNDARVVQLPQTKIPPPVVNRSVPPVRFQQRPVDSSQKIRIIDGVEYIETKRVVSSRITL